MRILLISSYVAAGGVGLSANLAPLHAAGIEAIALPTVILSNHPGHAKSAEAPIAASALTDMADALDSNGWLAGLDAIFAGYMPSPEHAVAARRVMDQARRRSPQTVYVCDPILGDDPKGLYVSEVTAAAIRDELAANADVVTPNRYELSWLTGMAVSDVQSTSAAARRLGRLCTVATSIPMPHDAIGNVLVTAAGTSVAATGRRARAPHGTGDLFTGFLLAEIVQKASFVAGLASATGGVEHALQVGRDTDLSLSAIDWSRGVKPAKVEAWV